MDALSIELRYKLDFIISILGKLYMVVLFFILSSRLLLNPQQEADPLTP
jgi:hypothetical protein